VYQPHNIYILSFLAIFIILEVSFNINMDLYTQTQTLEMDSTIQAFASNPPEAALNTTQE
jgi:hypothetical protein